MQRIAMSRTIETAAFVRKALEDAKRNASAGHRGEDHGGLRCASQSVNIRGCALTEEATIEAYENWLRSRLAQKRGGSTCASSCVEAQ